MIILEIGKLFTGGSLTRLDHADKAKIGKVYKGCIAKIK